MAKRFCDLNITLPDEQKIFNCPQTSITDILNTEIEVIDFLPDIKTMHGAGRFLIQFRNAETGVTAKFFTAASQLKAVLAQIDRDTDLPFITVIKATRCGNSKIYRFT